MVSKIIFGFIVFIIAVSMSSCVGSDPVISVKDIPSPEPGFTVRAQTSCVIGEDGQPVPGSFTIAIDDDCVDAPDASAIIAHEFGHVKDWTWTEAQCDEFAFQVSGIPIMDAFSGVH